MEYWREWLYLIGVAASAVFAGRFILQWVTSEMQGKSVVTRGFWQLSLAANMLMVIHSIIQSQYHVGLIQGCNAVMSWRNLNLMEEEHNHATLRTVIASFIGITTLVTAAFVAQGLWTESGFDWFRAPVTPWSKEHVGVSTLWHVLGFLGLFLFSLRYWVQWWAAEKHRVSHLGRTFWVISLIGNALVVVYFFRIGDLVNLVGPSMAIIPYVRNLILATRHKKLTERRV